MKRIDILLAGIPLIITSLSLWILAHGSWNLFQRQLVFSLLGITAMVVLSRMRYLWWIRISHLLYILVLGSLVFVLLFGHEAHGARSWFSLGPIHIQPSEPLKVILCLTLVPFLKRRDRFRPWFMGITALLSIGLVLMQPDLGSAAVLIFILAMAFFLSPLSMRYLVYGIVSFMLVVIVSWFFLLKPYQKQRVLTYFFPERAPANVRYQVEQSLIAIGSGGWMGKGIESSTQGQLRFLPAQYTDFIFAVHAEQRGFVGVAALLLLYLVFFVRVFTVVQQLGEDEGKLLGLLIMSFLLFHVGYNTGMVAAVVPITGIPLPFMSYGGSFLVTCYMAVGFLLNLSAHRFGAP